MFEVTSAWKSAFPEAHAGVLVMRDVINPAYHPELEKRKTEIEEGLRSQLSGQDRAAMSNLPVLQAYNTYYRRFKKTYHVQLQLESIAWKGKSIPNVSTLVEAMFMAEMKNMLLTAGHDLDTLHLPLTLDVSQGNEIYTLLRGTDQVLKADDMMISDQAGVISSIIYGPDQRTQIAANTHNVVFTVYAPAGVDVQAVTRHMQDIQEYVMLIAPQAQVELLNMFGTV
ncbi:MAG: phenylalanine--tRNA ligase beta subunit-related protein [Chloroflexota bacterium]